MQRTTKSRCKKVGLSSLNVFIMCLYSNKLINQKYQPNKKNKGIAPTLADYRLQTIETGCGWCEECRREISNFWRIRLYEEIKANKENINFVTLSFSPAAIKELENEMYENEYRGIKQSKKRKLTDVNLLAGYAIRKFTERWRKKHKKAPRHWLISELGHESSERIHLHGLIWGSKDDIIEKWQYGNIFIGSYVNERTINYIMKYVTKIDVDHDGYKQRIYTSKGIGKNYIETHKDIHKYKGEDTINYYTTYNGYKLKLPRYYKEKIWTEEEREEIWKLNLDKNITTLTGNKFDKKDESEKQIKRYDNILNTARESNELKKYGNNKTVNKTYIVTDNMKKHCKDIKPHEEVKAIQKRKIERIITNENTEPYTKSKNHDTIVYGEYINDTTEAQRNYNELLKDAKTLGISVRKLRLIKDGILTFNSQVTAKKQIELGELLINLLKNKYENS